jgi:hypothetical protein
MSGGLELRGVVKRFGDVTVVQQLDLCRRGRRVHGAAGRVRLRQDHHAAHDRGAGGRDRGPGAHRRPRRDARAPDGARHRDGVPELRALPAHGRGAQHVVCAAAGAAAAGRGRCQGGGRGQGAEHRGAAGTQAQGALGRAAPARGHRPRDRARAAGVPVRRAAVQPGRQAARPHARRARAAARAPGQDHGLRHPRPGRGDDAGQPHLHLRQGAASSRWARLPRCSTGRPTASSPASSARRR